MKITILDNVFCKIDDPAAIAPILEYNTEFWKQGPFGVKKKVGKAYMVNRRNGEFLAGLLPRIMAANKDVQIKGVYKKPLIGKVDLRNGIKLRDYQVVLVDKMMKAGRGVIEAATGSGKTLVGVALASLFRKKGRVLFLCPTKSLFTQTIDVFKQQEFSVCEVGDAQVWTEEKLRNSQVTVAIINSFEKIPEHMVVDLYNMVIVDEVHRVNDLKKRYGEVLQRLNCWNKFGLSATVQRDRYALLSLEGLIGPVIAEYTSEEGIESDNMAKPKITLIPIKRNETIAEIRTYKDIYKQAVVVNNFRNMVIAKESKKRADNNKSVLIIVREIEHGVLLLKCMNLIGAKAKYVNGGTPGQIREQVKQLISSKEIMIVICTDIWTEGIDIPSLDCVVNARGGKSRREVLQSVGRGTRTVEGKTELEIIELCDPYNYLSTHFVIRLTIYHERGWL